MDGHDRRGRGLISRTINYHWAVLASYLIAIWALIGSHMLRDVFSASSFVGYIIVANFFSWLAFEIWGFWYFGRQFGWSLLGAPLGLYWIVFFGLYFSY